MVRAAVFAAACVLLAAPGHVLMSGRAVPRPVAAPALAGAGAAGWWLAGREHGVAAVTAVAVALHTALHLGFSPAQAATAPLPIAAGAGGAHARHLAPVLAHSAAPAGHATAGTSPAAMPAAHPLAALLCAPWLAYGSAAPSASCARGPPPCSPHCGRCAARPRRRTGRASARAARTGCTRRAGCSPAGPSPRGVRRPVPPSSDSRRPAPVRVAVRPSPGPPPGRRRVRSLPEGHQAMPPALSTLRAAEDRPARHTGGADGAVTLPAPAARDGDPRCTDRFVRSLHRDVGRYVAHLSADPQAADDLTQDTFLRALGALGCPVGTGRARARGRAPHWSPSWRTPGRRPRPPPVPRGRGAGGGGGPAATVATGR
ncbi:sigma factor [Streptomyces sp. NPDC058646]|uniref:sigma factor n=1 Tax=Streptomyces sp. NPDC058646 TaxID=3346574 RepID=UPI003668440B